MGIEDGIGKAAEQAKKVVTGDSDDEAMEKERREGSRDVSHSRNQDRTDIPGTDDDEGW
ncbi:hypothetical protein ACFVYD_19275 [Streptomyces sp. NPDC058301]|uniref:hypothetical protein n=1 Tax=Streptomyces sp. NPDC058301 TaxID=3346436 RepID=UPI0036ECA0EF